MTNNITKNDATLPPKKVEFWVFVSLWNQLQNQTTPMHHYKMALWLEAAWKNGDNNLLLMAFRGGGKSTICGLFSAWLLYTNPNLRILVLAAESALARKMVRNVRRIIERHPLTMMLKPQKAEQWASDRFTLNRSTELRDPSMMARGIASNITGSRADIIICDDVEVPATCGSADKREALRERLMEMNYVLVPGGTQLYIGTPHDYYSIYASEPRGEIGEEEIFLNGFSRYLLPIMDKDGQSAWADRFSLEDIQNIKDKSGPNKFASQMLLRPMNITQGYLKVEKLKFYGGDQHLSAELGQMHIDGKIMASSSAYWDPSMAKKTGDYSVLAIIFVCEGGHIYLHHLEYLQVDLSSRETETDQQCRRVAMLCQKYRVHKIGVEANGVGATFPHFLRKHIDKCGRNTTVSQKHSHVAKDTRILDAFDAFLASEMIHVHESVCDTPFVQEMREWRPKGQGNRGGYKGHDDGLDAVAGAIAMEPNRTSSEFLNPLNRKRWGTSAKPLVAKTDFTV